MRITSAIIAEVSLWFLLLSAGSWGDEPKIAPVQIAGRLLAVGQVQSISGGEFAFFNLAGYEGPVTWDATLPDGSDGPLPVKYFETIEGQPIIGVRVGTTLPDVHPSPGGQSVAVFAVASGRVSLAAWGVKDGRSYKIATLMVQANVGPRPPPDPVKPDDPKPGPSPQPQPELPGDAGILAAIAERIASGRLVDSDEAYLTLYGLVDQGDLTKSTADKVDAALTLKAKPRQLKPADAELVKGVK